MGRKDGQQRKTGSNLTGHCSWVQTPKQRALESHAGQHEAALFLNLLGSKQKQAVTSFSPNPHPSLSLSQTTSWVNGRRGRNKPIRDVEPALLGVKWGRGGGGWSIYQTNSIKEENRGWESCVQGHCAFVPGVLLPPPANTASQDPGV